LELSIFWHPICSIEGMRYLGILMLLFSACGSRADPQLIELPLSLPEVRGSCMCGLSIYPKEIVQPSCEKLQDAVNEICRGAKTCTQIQSEDCPYLY